MAKIIMIIITCIDDDFGMLFNNRRQSQDSLLRARIVELTKNSKLWMNNYSEKLFAKDAARHIFYDDNFLSKASPGEFCFVENVDIKPYLDSIEQLIIYKWNRRYPSDVKFTISLSKWRLEKTTDFTGSSHEKITEELYTK